MTIHHDKLAYGRLASMKEDSDEAKLKAMAKRLSEACEDKEEGKADPDCAAQPENGEVKPNKEI